MSWIVRKELRELRPVLGIVLLAMAIAGFVLVPERRAFDSYAWLCAGSGLLIGGFQTWLDLRAEGDAFLRHRALGQTAVRLARTAAGLLALALGVLAPWLALLLVPGRHGYDVWMTRFDSAQAGDLSFSHAVVGFGLAATFWSLARVGSTLRSAWMRPVAKVALVGVGLLALLTRDNDARTWLLVLVPVAATALVCFPLRDDRTLGAARMFRPAALLALACLCLPWMETGMLARTLLRHALSSSFPHLRVAEESGGVRLRLSEGRGDEMAHVREWDAARETLLYDSDRSGDELVPSNHAGRTTSRISDSEQELNAGRLWAVAPSWWDHRTLEEGDEGHIIGRAKGTTRYRTGTRIVYREGRFMVLEPRDGKAELEIGSIGPDGWVEGPRGVDAPRFSPESFVAPRHHAWSVANGLTAGQWRTIVDVVSGRVVRIEMSDSGGEDEDEDGDPSAEELVRPTFDVVITRLPPGGSGVLRLEPSVRNFASVRGRTGESWNALDAIALRDDSRLLVVNPKVGDVAAYPLEADEALGMWHPMPVPEAPTYFVRRPPFVDDVWHLHMRARPAGAEQFTTTEFVLQADRPYEHLLSTALGGYSLLRPPALNAVSFATPAPRTWEELETRWWRDGVVAGGHGALWFVLSLAIAVLCGLHNRYHVARRTADPRAPLAWGIVGALLGPMGVLWMEMCVRRSALRSAPDGRKLAVHVAADWPAPAPTGREVLLTP